MTLTERIHIALGSDVAAEAVDALAGKIAADLGESAEAWRGALIVALIARGFLVDGTVAPHRACAGLGATLGVLVDQPAARLAMDALEART